MLDDGDDDDDVDDDDVDDDEHDDDNDDDYADDHDDDDDDDDDDDGTDDGADDDADDHDDDDGDDGDDDDGAQYNLRTQYRLGAATMKWSAKSSELIQYWKRSCHVKISWWGMKIHQPLWTINWRWLINMKFIFMSSPSSFSWSCSSSSSAEFSRPRG